MKRVLIFLTFVLVLIATAALLLPGPMLALAENGPTPDFPVHLYCGDVYWASYSDYLDHLLTVEYQLGTDSTGPAYNVTLHSATATDNVVSSTIIPIWMGDFAASQSQVQKIKWNIPDGVTHFRTTIQICASCDGSICVDGSNGGIDIKPGSCPNAININAGGVVAVAVFSQGQFDARTLVTGTIDFAGAAPVGRSDEDKNGDGLMDVVFHFDRADLDLQLGDLRACLSGTTTGGDSFRSCDMLKIIDN